MPDKRKKKAREDAIEMLKQKAANNGLKNQAQQGANFEKANRPRQSVSTSQSANSSTTPRNTIQSTMRGSQSPSAVNSLFKETARKATGNRLTSTDKYGSGSARGDDRGVRTSTTTSLRDKAGVTLKNRRDIDRYDEQRATRLRNNKLDVKSGQTVKGAGKQWLGGQISNVGTTVQELETTANSYNKARAEKESNNYSLRSREDAERREASAMRNLGVKENIRLKDVDRVYKYDPNSFSQRAIRTGDKLIESGSKDIEKAKEGLGAVGRLGVDLGANALQMMGDRVMAFVPGVGQALAMGSLVNRAGGTASYEARQQGANPDQQFMYAQGVGLIEGLSEGIFNSVSAFRSTYGRGAFSLADRLTTRTAASNIVQKYLKSDLGKSLAVNLARLGAQGFEEGFEEVVADIAEPALKYALMGSFDGYDPKEIAYDFMVGALMGAIPGSAEAFRGVESDVAMSKAMRDGQLHAENVINRGLVQGREGQNVSDAEVLARQMQGMMDRGQQIQPAQVRMLQEAIGQSQETNARAFERRSTEETQRAVQEGRLRETTGTRAEATAYERGIGAVEQRSEEKARHVMGADASPVSVGAVGRVVSGTADIDDFETILTDSKAKEAVETITGSKLSVDNAQARSTLEDLTVMNEIANKDTVRKEVQTAHAEDIRAELTNMDKRGGDIFAKNYAEAVSIIGSGAEYEDVFTRLYADGTVKEANFEDAYNRIVLQRGGEVAQYFTEAKAKEAFNAGRMAMITQNGQTAAKNMAEKMAAKPSGLTFEGNAKSKLSNKQINALTKFAERGNVHIRVVETMSKTLDDGTVLSANGSYRDGTIYIAADASNKLVTVAKHEMTHHIKKMSPERYQELEDFVFRKWYDNDATKMEDEIRKKQLLYGDISVEEAREEIIADASEAFFTDQGAIQEVCSFSKKLGRAIHDGIKTLLDTLLDLQDSDNLSRRGYGDFLDDIDILREAEKMWLDALNDTVEKSREASTKNDSKELKDFLEENGLTKLEQNPKMSLKETEDNQGRKLTDGQKEFFKDSKATDENGRLAVVYHTTEKGGFTVFDPKYSDDKRSLFFASNFDISQTYGRNAYKHINPDMPEFTSWYDFEDYAAENFRGWDNTKLISDNLNAVVEPNERAAYGTKAIPFEEWIKRKSKRTQFDVYISIPLPNGNYYNLRNDSPQGLLKDINDVLKRTNGKGYYACYLNLENPLVVEGNKSVWHSIPYSPSGESNLEDKIEGRKKDSYVGVSNIKVYYDWSENGFPTALHYSFDVMSKADGWKERHVEKTITAEELGYEDAADQATPDFETDAWLDFEDALMDEGLTSDYVVDYLEGEKIDFNGEIDYRPSNPTGYDFFYEDGTPHELNDEPGANGFEYKTTRELAEIAERDGYDGVVIRNITDIGGRSRLRKGASPYSDIYIAFNSNQVKLTSNEGPTENDDIRYSLSSSFEAVGCDIRKENGMIKAFDSDGVEIKEFKPSYIRKSPLGRLLSLAVNKKILTDSDVTQQAQFLSRLYNMILNTQDPDLIWAVSGTIGYDPKHGIGKDSDWLKESKSKFASITGNSDPQYDTTIDFTTICVKTQAIIDAMSKLMIDLGRGLTEHEIIDIVYKETARAGEQVPCPVCYVFSRWVGLGNLFGKIKQFQQDYPENMDMTEVRKEYEKIKKQVDKLVSEQKGKKSGTKAREQLYAETIERKDLLDLKRQMPNKKLTEAEEKELEAISNRLEILDHWSWLEKTRLADDYKAVPDDVLFDLNAGRTFAMDYPATWRFRTTRGPSLGKAVAPYSPSRLGDTIRGIASPSTLGKLGNSNRVFLNKNGLSKTARNAYNKAIENAKRQNRMNGQRLQSTSDFRFEYGLDYLLSFIELEAIGAKAQMYTKVPEAVKFLASTGTEVNCSVMAKGSGVVKNRKVGDHYIGIDIFTGKEIETDQEYSLVFSDITGMSIKDALTLSRAYNNVQPILVGISRAHMIAAMANKYITMIIPFHSSGSSEGRYRSMMEAVGEAVEGRTPFEEYENEHDIENATPEQKLCRKLRVDILTGKFKDTELTDKEQQALKNNEILRQLFIRIYGKDINGKEAKPNKKYVENFDENGNDADCYGVYLTKKQAGVMMPYEYWDKHSTIKDADKQGEAYVKYCESLGITPVFSGWDSKGKYHEDMDFSSYPGYWKTLIDRKMYNNDGTYHKQQAVNVKNVDLDMLDSNAMKDGIFKPMQTQNTEKTQTIVERSKATIAAEEAEDKFSLKEDNLGYHAGDLGKSTGDDYFGQGYRRGTGHFGFGTYFVGDRMQLNDSSYGTRPVETVDFDKYNLYKPRNYDTGIRLHEALKIVDGFAKRYSEFSKYKGLDNWDERHYKTNGILNDIGEYVFELQNRDGIPDAEVKERIDKYVNEMPEAYRDRIDEEARKRYEKAQARKVDEQSVRRNLEGQYDRIWADTSYYDSKEAYVDSHLENELAWIREEKETTLDEWKYFAAEDIIKEYAEEWESDLNIVNRLVGELQMGLGFQKSEQEIEQALKTTEKTINEYEYGQRGLDSAATVFMKQLGYEGVDVRGIKGLDNTTYGSVIYDLKGEDLARKQEIGTARYQLKDSDSKDTIASQNTIAKLENQVKDLKAEFKRTDLKTADQKQARIQAGKLIQRHGSNMGVQKDLTDTFNKIFRLYKEKGTDAFDEVYEIAKDAAVNVVNNITEVHNEGREEYDAIKQYLRETPITISEDMKRNFGRLKIRNGETSNIDNVYMELMEMFPEQFTDDYVNPHDQLNHIVDVLDNFAPYYETLDGASEEMQDYVVDIASDIMETAYNLQTKKTFADKKYLEKEAAVKKAREKALESRNKALERQKTRYEKQADALKEELWKANERTAAAKLRGEMDIQRLKQQQAESKEKARERRAESRERTKLLNIARRLDKLKTTAENRAQIDALISDLDLVAKGMTDKSLDKLYKLAQWYDDRSKNDHDFIPDSNIENKLKRLSKTHIKDMTIEEVRDLYDVLSNIENEIATEKKLINSEVKKEIYEAGRETIRDINRSHGIAKSLRKLDTFFISGTLSPLRQIRRVTGYNDNDPLYIATKELADGQRKMLQYQMDSWKAFDKFMNDKKFINSLNGKSAEEIEVTGYKEGEPYSVKITPDIRMAMYLAGMNDDNLRHMKYGGITLPDIKLYKKGKISEAMEAGETVKFSPSQIREITSHMSEREKEFAQEAYKYYNITSPQAINEVSEVLKGYSLARVDNYFPIHTDSDYLTKEFESMKFDGTIEGMGFLKERVKASNPILMTGLVDTLTKSIEMNSKYVGLAIPVRNFSKIYGVKDMTWDEEGNAEFNGSVKRSISKKWGKSVASYIEKFMTDLQNGRKSTDEWGGVFSRARSRYAGAVLTLNASVAIKQAASYPTAAAVLGWAPLAKAMGNVGKVDLDLIAKYTPLQWYRSKGYSTTELGDITSSRTGNIPTPLNWIQGMDLLTTRKLWKASEYYVRQHNKNLKAGTNEYYKAVADIYNRVIEETQPNYTTMQRPGLLRSDNEITLTLNMFKTQPYQNFNILFDAFGNFVAKRNQYKSSKSIESKKALKEANRDMQNAVTSQIAQLAVFAAMTSLWALFRRKDDKYKDEEGKLTIFSYMKKLGEDMISNLFADVPLGADIYSMASSVFTGDTYYGFTSVTDSAITDVMDSFKNGAVAVGDWIEYGRSDNPEKKPSSDMYKETENVISSASRAMGIPASNLRNLVNGIYGWVAVSADGEYIGTYEAQKMTFAKEKEMKQNLFRAYQNDKAAYEELRKMMIEDGFDEAKLDDYITRQRREHHTEEEQKAIDSSMQKLEGSNIWKDATEEEKTDFTNRVTNMALGITNTDTESITKYAVNGLTNEQVILYKLALKKADRQANNNGSYDNDEKEAAIRMLERNYKLTEQQKKTLTGKKS